VMGYDCSREDMSLMVGRRGREWDRCQKVRGNERG
jgi:hypothetical protein